MKQLRSLLAIPVYNEAAHLAEVLTESARFIKDILVIDDGSRDGSGDLLASFPQVRAIRHERNLGYGRSVADAFEYAIRNRYDWLVTLDCDWQHEPAFIPKFLEAASMENADLISGSRYLTSFDGNSLPPSDRQRINGLITGKLNDLLGLGITDAFCGFKAYRVSSLRRLQITVDGYAMPIQFWVQAWRCKLRISELPIPLIYNDPNRHFGGGLDDPEIRLAHYQQVLEAELSAIRGAPAESPCQRMRAESAQPIRRHGDDALCGCSH